MDDKIIYKLLSQISENGSIGILFKLGYSYSNIVNWYFDLEKYGYVVTDEDGDRVLTTLGKQKLRELEKKGMKKDIGKLEQYKMVKKPLEDVYLP